jgi:hypothetical protein
MHARARTRERARATRDDAGRIAAAERRAPAVS